MKGKANREKIWQVEKIVRGRSGSVGMVEDLRKRKRSEMEGMGGGMIRKRRRYETL